MISRRAQNLLVIGCTALIGALMGWSSRYIVPTQVEIHGLQDIDRLSVIAAIEPWLDRSLVSFPADLLAQDLLHEFVFKDVRINVRWPDSLVIHIRERTAAMWMLTSNGAYVVDEEGYRIRAIEFVAGQEVPVLLQGCPYDQRPKTACMERAGKLFRDLKFSGLSLQSLSAIEMRDRGIELWLKDGVRVRFGDESNVAEKVAVIQRAQRTLGRRGHGLLRVDVQQPTRPVVQLTKPLTES